MNQCYNMDVVEGHGGMVRSNIGVAEGKFQFNKKLTLRAEAQYLATRQDEGDWCYGLLELSVLPYFMFTLSDMWNCGETNPNTPNNIYSALIFLTLYKRKRVE